MKTRGAPFILHALVAFTAVLSAKQAQSQSALYSNASTYTGNFNLGDGVSGTAGNEVVLVGSSTTDEIVQAQVQIDLINSGASPLAGTPVGTEAMALNFYLNNGQEYNGFSSPGTLLWSSGFSTLQAIGLTNFTQGVTLTYSPGVIVPRDFTWALVFSNVPAGESAGLSLFSTPAIGDNYADAWVVIEPGDFWTLIEAAQAVSTVIPALEFGAQFQGTAYVPPQPGVFQSIQVQTNGVQIGFTGTIGGTYTLNVSTNLLTWSALATFTNINGSVQYDDSSASNFPARYYMLTGSSTVLDPSSIIPTLGAPFTLLPTNVNTYGQSEIVPVPPNRDGPPGP